MTRELPHHLTVKPDALYGLFQVAQEVRATRVATQAGDSRHSGAKPNMSAKPMYRRRNLRAMDAALAWAARWVRKKHLPCSIKVISPGGQYHWPLVGIVRRVIDQRRRAQPAPGCEAESTTIVFDQYDTAGRIVRTVNPSQP